VRAGRRRKHLHGARRIRFGRVVGERAAEAGARGGEEGHGPRAMGMPAAGDRS
jgi:hypothetical protein